MYCLDSHATDVEHFWPKSRFPERMFRWPNLLLGCAECGRFKGERFPLDGSAPLLVDPTAEDPWLQLDFDPTTGSVMARYDTQARAPTPRGSATVELLQLNAREALNEGYRKTYGRLRQAVENSITRGAVDAIGLLRELEELDDHGLLAWCFSQRGLTESAFRELHDRHYAVWQHCAAAVGAA